MPDGRNILSTIVQSSVVELFRGYGVSVAPLPKGAIVEGASSSYVGASMTYLSSVMTGTLCLHVPQALFQLMKHPDNVAMKVSDLTREFCNQLAGRIKNRLLTYKIVLKMGIPTSVSLDTRVIRRDERHEYLEFSFRSLRGEVFVTLRGSMDYAAIVYAGSNEAAAEGDVILF